MLERVLQKAGGEELFFRGNSVSKSKTALMKISKARAAALLTVCMLSVAIAALATDAASSDKPAERSKDNAWTAEGVADALKNGMWPKPICFKGSSDGAKERAASGAESPSKDGDGGCRPWTAVDSIAVRYFDQDKVTVSPDGSKFYFVSFHGDVLCDCNIYELSVFSTGALRLALTKGMQALRPLRTLTMHSAGHVSAGIEFPRWEHGGDALLFQGVSATGVRQLFNFHIQSGVISALTNETDEVYSYEREGDGLVTNLLVPANARVPAYPVHVLSRDEIIAGLFPRSASVQMITRVSYLGGGAIELNSTEYVAGASAAFSADGKRAVILRRPKEVPKAWRSYSRLNEAVAAGRTEDYEVSEFVLVDPQKGLQKVVFDAPSGDATLVGAERRNWVDPRALWAQDGRHLVLVNSALPIVPGNDSERKEMAYIVGYDADTGKWSAIEPLEVRRPNKPVIRVSEVGWLEAGRVLFVGHEMGGKFISGTTYRLRGGTWTGHTSKSSVKTRRGDSESRPSLNGGVSVSLRQSANEPAAMIGTDGARNVTLTTPDPALADVRFARQVPFQWNELGGTMRTGGLLLPTNGATVNIPLVIQAYTYDADHFEPDGPGRHAYAAQSLAANGFAVLNIDIPAADNYSLAGTHEESLEFVSRVDSAANALAKRGLVDRMKVGVVGFSRAGFNVFYAITHPEQVPIAAAVIDDAFTGSYSSYLLAESISAQNPEYQRLYSGTFWENKDAWLQRETSFNADRIETPTLFAVHNEQLASSVLGVIGALEINRRPFEYLVFPFGGHALTLPKQRVASQEATLDWMEFWLQGRAPADAERAGRWAKLHEQQNEALRKPRKPPTHFLEIDDSTGQPYVRQSATH